MNSLTYGYRGSFGLAVKRGVTDPETVKSLDLDPKTQHCRAFKFSNNGQYLAYCDSSRTVVIETATGSEVFTIDKSKTQQIDFSPRDTVMVTYEPYVIYGSSRTNPDGTMKVPPPNLNFWSLSAKSSSGNRHLKEFIVKKQSTWRPQFTDDETKTLRLSEKGVFVYNNLDFEKGENIAVKDLISFAISPGNNPHMMCFTPSIKGQPALLQLRQLNADLRVVYQKSSFNCDKCDMNWNSKGTAVIVTTSVDVDKSGKSYYGVSHLHCITTKLDYFPVPLDDSGSLHYVEWSPSGNQFCVCYGLMPSKVTIFNARCEVLWNIGEGHRNEVHYSPFGDILVTCAFRNISSGKMTFWNVETREEIVEYEAPMTTHFEWAPDGKHFLTATTAPHLRRDNRWSIWNYATGVVYDKVFTTEELWQVTWKPTKVFQKSQIVSLTSQQKNAALASSLRSGAEKSHLDRLPSGAITKSGRYVPPALRKGTPASNKSSSARPALSEVEKKIKSLQKKLDDIGKLKEKQQFGVVLELNQLKKIHSEDSLRTELEKLSLES